MNGVSKPIVSTQNNTGNLGYTKINGVSKRRVPISYYISHNGNMGKDQEWCPQTMSHECVYSVTNHTLQPIKTIGSFSRQMAVHNNISNVILQGLERAVCTRH